MDKAIEELVIRKVDDDTFKIVRRQTEPWRLRVQAALDLAGNILAFRSLTAKKNAPKPWPLRWACVDPVQPHAISVDHRDPASPLNRWGAPNRTPVKWSDWTTGPRCTYSWSIYVYLKDKDKPETAESYHLGVQILTVSGLVFACEYAIENDPDYRRSQGVLEIPAEERTVGFSLTKQFAENVFAFAGDLYRGQDLPLQDALGLRDVLGTKMCFDLGKLGPQFPDAEFSTCATCGGERDISSATIETDTEPLFDDLRHAFGDPELSGTA